MTDTAATFADLGLRPPVLRALDALGYEEPTPVQQAAIGPIVAGRDVLARAATGTGKTAAFALPILERIVTGAEPTPLALVLVPTRELAVQVSEAVYRYGRELDARVLPLYGGQPVGRQLAVLRRGVHVVVATPGRALDHLQRGTLPLGDVGLVVLDEADEMLDLGFAEDIDTLLDACPTGHQTVLFSATMPRRIATVADRHLTDPVRIDIDQPAPEDGEAPRVRQQAYVVARAHKTAALGRILDVESPGSALVFCRTRGEVDELTESLNGRGYRAEALHGGMDQAQRDRVMGRLRAGTADLLVATDVAARGLDVDRLTHVVNYDLPSAPEAYVHRIGRVGRAGREGVAISLAEPRQRRLLDAIGEATGTPISVERIPTVADLRARQLELTLEQVREAAEGDDLERFRPVLDALVDDDLDPTEVALAAIALVHEAGGGDEEAEEIPQPAERRRGPGDDRGRAKGPKGPKGDRARSGDGGDRPPRRGPSGPTARLYVGAGRHDRVRPQDLVGAIAGETDLRGHDIGAIRIFDRFALVDVPEAAADRVIAALRATTVRGRKVSVRHDREQGDQPERSRGAKPRRQPPR